MSETSEEARMSEQPTRTCDLVMKGGITSGTVYPKLVLRLADGYRFVNIGGTSAGAIAAGLTAAAEYGRKDGGFEALEKVPGILQKHLLDFFQPHPSHRKTFAGLRKLLLRGEPIELTFTTIVRKIPLILRVWKSYRKLPQTDYGLCPGTTQKKARFPALTDWLNVQLELLSGRIASVDAPLPEKPLTYGDLASRGVTLRTVTTDLSSRNPVLLPFRKRTWMFREDELPRLLPDNVSRWLLRRSDPVEGWPGFFQLPEAEDLPVLLGVRASLSFPILFAALPLYQRDFGLKDEAKRQTPRRCWLSDGGISSNFPIHLFDDPFPERPTFGISLGEFDPDRQREPPEVPEGRVYLPKTAGAGQTRAIYPIESPFAFLAAILDTARNWQDQLQSVLPGYRERIVRIYLTKDEGGLNLEMDEETVEKLVRYGEIAGRRLTDDFIFEEHRWRRFLTAYAAFEEAFESMAESWDEGFGQAIREHDPKSYPPSPADQKDEILVRAEELVALARKWSGAPLRERWRGNKGMPRPRTHLKQVPSEQAAGVTGAADAGE